MAQEPAKRPRNLRMVRGRPAEIPVLDLAEGIQVYYDLLSQSRQLQALTQELRGRLLRAMDSLGLEVYESGGLQAIRRVRHLPPHVNRREAECILRNVGRLDEAQTPMLDTEKARRVIDDLYRHGLLRREDLPFSEPRDVDILIVHSVEDERESESR